ncbi:MAG: AbrB/MazE/SpoVT family DNA-binding domain-containing protein [Firmicutes bacterium]|nr:AbrB/MazE/SpoVT family DNA-binding domain-containing protein [Bacillota bacterium]
MIVKMTDRGQIVIPEEIRGKLGLASGQQLEIMEHRGMVWLRPLLTSPLIGARGRFRGARLVDALLAEREHDG